MQKSVHPQTISTVIRGKDGSFFMKHWLYFRDVLQLEIDTNSHPTWTLSTSNKQRIDNSSEDFSLFNKSLIVSKLRAI